MAAATISIELEPEAAKAYAVAPEEQRRQLQMFCNLWLRGSAVPRRELRDIMNEMAAEAKANGLTPEILAEILADES